MIYIYLNKKRKEVNKMLELLAKLGAAVAATPFTLLIVFDEEECPKSLLK